MLVIIKVVISILCLMLFFVRSDKKLLIIVFSMLCFNAISLLNGEIGHSLKLISCCFILSEIKNIKKHITQDLIFLMILSYIPIIILHANSPLYSGISGLIKLTIYEFICGNVILLFGIIALNKKTTLSPFFHTIYYSMLIITFFGVLNLIIGYSPWLEMMGISFNFLEYSRFRIQSMFIYPFDYGYICIAVLFFSLYGYKKNYLAKEKWYIILICSLFGIIFCGCRTILFCALIGLFILFTLTYKPIRLIKYLILACSLIGVCYCFIPAVQDYINFMMTVFDTGNEVGSSSLSMRGEQTLAVLYYISANLAFGRGYGFFYHDLNWADGHEGSIDNSLQGLEGVHLSYLLERGFVGYGLYLIFYIVLLSLIWKKRETDKFGASIATTILICYLAFSHMTGELNALYPTLFFIGVLLKIMSIENNEQTSYNNSSI